jgi:PAS domain S-box-containing protein
MKSFVKYLFLLVILQFQSVTILAENNQEDIHSKTYKVGLSNVQGLMYVNDLGELTGFPFEILIHLTNDENIQIEWIEGSWSSLYNKLINGEIDMLPGTQVSQKRKKHIDYLRSSMFAMWSELYLSDNVRFESLYDLTGKKVALVIDDNNAIGFIDYVKGFKIEYIPVSYSSHSDAIKALEAGDVYAMVGPTSSLLNETFKGLRNAKLYFNPTDLNIGFTKDKNKELQVILNRRLEIYKNDPNSVYYDLIRQYNLGNIKHEITFFPLWAKYLGIILFVVVFIASVFVYVLRKRVGIKTNELNNGERFLSNVLEIGEMGGWSMNLNTNKVFWSDELYHLHGLSPNKKISIEEMRNVIFEEDRERAMFLIQKNIQEKENFVLEYRVTHSNGEILNTQQIGVFDISENSNQVIGITKNITKEKAYQKELIEAKEKAEENDKLKSLFINNMSHEIRTPMNGIMGFASMLEKPDISDEKRKSFISIIRKSSLKLLRIIEDLMEISMLGTKQVKVQESSVCLNQLMEELKSIFEIKSDLNGIKVKFNQSYTNEQSTFNTDESKLNKILANIIENAIKFTQKGYVELSFEINKDVVKIYIKDTGIGIKTENACRIFERFYQTDKEHGVHEGLGLGLAIAKENAELLNGKLTFDSVYKEGSTFMLELPFKIEVEEKNNLFEDIEESKAKKMDVIKILIAEDEVINMQYLEIILSENKRYDFEIIKAWNGDEAVRKCKSDSEIKLLLIDLKMPVLNGFEAVKIIREIYPEIPIIAQTAYTSNVELNKAKQAGCNDVISKPISEQDISKLLDKYL